MEMNSTIHRHVRKFFAGSNISIENAEPNHESETIVETSQSIGGSTVRGKDSDMSGYVTPQNRQDPIYVLP